MLSYLISAALAAVVGTAGGFVGSRMANANLRRGHVAAYAMFDEQIGELQKPLADRPTREELAPALGTLVQAVQQHAQTLAGVVTREQLEPVLA
jgi:hypothetical protein